MKKKFIALILILSLAAFMALKIELDKISREKVPGSSIIYIPSGKYLKFATFGYSSLLADLVYLWAIQYYSNYSIVDRFKYLDHIFSVTAELDPHYLDPFQIGALIAVYEAKDLNLALKILDKALEKNPDQWIFPFQAGHYAQMLIKDYKLAQKYYKKTMEIPGAPPITKRLYANAAFELGNYEAAWKDWKEVYEKTKDERIKKIASNHLYRVKAAIDIKAIKEAIAKYQQRYSQKPMDLSQLMRAGFFNVLPKDFDGKDYLYDPQTGEVQAPSNPWKR